MTLLGVVVALVMLLGLAGSLAPVLPGPPLVLAGALLHAIATDFTPIGAGRLGILALLAALGWALGLAAGALVGAVVGLAFAPLGLLAGPLAGAIAAEGLATGRAGPSVRSGLGALGGAAAGAVSNFAIALVMIALVAWWVWRG